LLTTVPTMLVQPTSSLSVWEYQQRKDLSYILLLHFAPPREPDTLFDKAWSDFQ
jgi:hypothetical protein